MKNKEINLFGDVRLVLLIYAAVFFQENLVFELLDRKLKDIHKKYIYHSISIELITAN